MSDDLSDLEIAVLCDLLDGPNANTESLRTQVSVAGKRNFEARDTAAETAVKVQKRRCRDRISLTNPAHSGGIRREPGNLRSDRVRKNPGENGCGLR